MEVDPAAFSLECIASRDIALIGRGIHELPVPGHVAGRPNSRVGGLEIVAYLDRLTVGELDAGLLQAQALRIRSAPSCDKDLIDLQFLMPTCLAETDAPSAIDPFDSGRLRVGDHLGALLFEDSPKRLRGLRLLARRHFTASDEGHHTAKAHEQLAHLQSDRTRTQNRQPLRWLAKLERRRAGEIARIFQTSYRRNRGRRTRGDDVFAGAYPLPAALDGVCVDELGRALADREAVGICQVDVLLLAKLVDQRCLRIHELAEIERR